MYFAAKFQPHAGAANKNIICIVCRNGPISDNIARNVVPNEKTYINKNNTTAMQPRTSYANYDSPNFGYNTMTAGVWCQPELNPANPPPSLLQKHFDFSQIERMRSIYTPGVQASTCYSGYSAAKALNIPYVSASAARSGVSTTGSYLTDTEKLRTRTMLSNPSYGTMRRR